MEPTCQQPPVAASPIKSKFASQLVTHCEDHHPHHLAGLCPKLYVCRHCKTGKPCHSPRSIGLSSHRRDFYGGPQTRYTAHSSPCNIVRFLASEQPVEAAITGGQGEPRLSLMYNAPRQWEFLAFPNLTGTLLSEAHFSSPQLSCVKDFVPHVKWPRQ